MRNTVCILGGLCQKQSPILDVNILHSLSVLMSNRNNGFVVVYGCCVMVVTGLAKYQ